VLTSSSAVPYLFVNGTFVGIDDAFSIASSLDLRERVDAALGKPSAVLKQQVLEEIHSNKIVAFTRSNCSISVKMQQAFVDAGEDVVCFNLDDGDVDAARELTIILQQLTGRSDFPQVFVSGRFEASGDGVTELLTSGISQRSNRAAAATHNKDLFQATASKHPRASELLNLHDGKSCGGQTVCDF